MFENLQDRLQGVFDQLTRRGRLSEADVDKALREVRLALLEADVNFKVVKAFIKRVRERAVGVEVTKTITPGQQVIKIVHEELLTTLGESARLDLGGGSPHIIMLVGLQGSGKTTHLQRVLLWCLHGGLDDLGLPHDMIPVFLPLRELKDVTQHLDDFIQDQLSQPHLGTPSGFGTRLLKRGHLLFLLDGLDEVSDTVYRAHVSRWIETAMTLYPTCWFVITCRFAGYTDDTRLGADFLEMHLRPLTTGQAESFAPTLEIVGQGLILLAGAAGGLALEAFKDVVKEKLTELFRRKLTREPTLQVEAVRQPGGAYLLVVRKE